MSFRQVRYGFGLPMRARHRWPRPLVVEASVWGPAMRCQGVGAVRFARRAVSRRARGVHDVFFRRCAIFAQGCSFYFSEFFDQNRTLLHSKEHILHNFAGASRRSEKALENGLPVNISAPKERWKNAFPTKIGVPKTRWKNVWSPKIVFLKTCWKNKFSAKFCF